VAREGNFKAGGKRTLMKENNGLTRYGRRSQVPGLAVAVLVLASCSSMSGGLAGDQDFYAVREKGAPPEIQRRLDQLRREIKAQGLTFEVGYTTALDRRLAELVGTKVPRDLGPELRSKTSWPLSYSK
jgi:hypothetical protein